MQNVKHNVVKLSYKNFGSPIAWEKVKEYIRHGGNINVIPMGQDLSLLGLCIFYGKMSIANKLINMGADVNLTKDCDVTPMLEACTSNDINLMKKLYDNGANVNWKDSDGYSLLHHAVLAGACDAIKFLAIDCELNVDTKNNRGITPLGILCLQFSDINQIRGYSPLSKRIVKTLLECGADINEISEESKRYLYDMGFFSMFNPDAIDMLGEIEMFHRR